MEIKHLSKENLNQAIKLVLKVFPYSEPTDEEYAPKWFKASLNPAKYKKDFKEVSVTYVKYWVAIEKDKVIGAIGIYTYKKDEKEANWLAWFFVDPNYRNKKIGSKLLDYIIEKTKEQKKTYLRLFTSSNPNEAKAQKIYDKRGFKITKIEKEVDKGYDKIYRELKIMY